MAPRRTQRRWPQSAIDHAWRWFLLALKLGAVLALLAAIAAMAGGAWLYRTYASDLPEPSEISLRRPAETTKIYARDGTTLLYELVDPQGERRTVVPFADIPLTLRRATVAVEDASFYQNPGVDFKAIVRAFVQNQRSDSIVSGASTITQQLVRNILLPPEERTQLTMERKIREAFLAFRVSREYSKDQVLGRYLNEVYYGHQAYGVEAAAQMYFGKPVAQLNDAESTMLAGLPQSPTTYDPFNNYQAAKARQRVVLDQMVRTGALSAEAAKGIYNTPLKLVAPRSDILAPHFVFYVRQLLEERYGPDALYRGGLKVVTSLDVGMQNKAQQIVADRVVNGVDGERPLRSRNATNAGAIMLSADNEILAMVGSVDYNDEAINGQVNVTLALRQPGSALKPIIYAAALQRGWTPATVLWDEPTEFKLGDGAVYAPVNYDNSFHGPQRVRMALANSLNIPAVQTLDFVGINAFVQQAHDLGITTLNDPSRFGLAMALGSNEVRLLDLTNVYSTFRDAGKMRQPVAILRVTDSRGAVLDSGASRPTRQALGAQGEQVAYLITDMLSDNQARWFMFGRGNVMELPEGRPAAVKTGTSNDWRDAWAIGYTPEVTVGVWVGNSDSTPMQEIAGVNGAGVIWRDLMNSYNDGRPIRAFERPKGIVDAQVCADTGALASQGCAGGTVEERFIAGTEPSQQDSQTQTVRVAGDGSCLAASYTPPDQVRMKQFPLYPERYREWARQRGIPQPPTAYCPPPAGDAAGSLASIALPSASAVVTTSQVFVSGTARGPFTLDVGKGDSPSGFSRINAGASPIGGGVLGVWDAGGLAPGSYTLRLRVRTPEGVDAETRRTVVVARP
ncbi:PBP1A family penicillin-binding protein [Chloroflexia bacterium SDU3-3]|nr:PBP1A family penicillin-binding protein [Chloroflexia bacterium SDU3-3]